MTAKKKDSAKKKEQNRLKRRMKAKKPLRKLQLKPENLLELKKLRNLWRQNVDIPYESYHLYNFDSNLCRSTKFQKISPAQILMLEAAEQLKLKRFRPKAGKSRDAGNPNKNDNSTQSSTSSSSTNFSEFSFHSLSSMTDPLEDLTD